MSTEIYNLFVYGSLRSGFRNPVYQYLTKYFHLRGEAVVKGKLYDMGEFPVARPTTEEKFISGELYAINDPREFSWAIGQLDDYEGLNAEEGETAPYKREEVIAYQDGQPHTSWIYWFNGNVDGKPEIESGDLLQYLQQKNKP
ncbi:MAG TPA: gamma-glutamylcyclotransferase [Ferruginibacter sp.]|nr:gamma-glutamylcyclotransferase [Chitinophagaceae bacterium]HRI23018.1 gamma-glutamylcyclotransferase [Ferruginibacter sp.]